MQQNPIDLSQLEELLAGAVEIDAVLRELLVQSRTDSAELEIALEKQDIAQVTRIAHRIKGAGRVVGANPLASVFEAMEQDGKQGRLSFVLEAKSELVRLIAWLDAHLNTAAGTNDGGAKP